MADPIPTAALTDRPVSRGVLMAIVPFVAALLLASVLTILVCPFLLMTTRQSPGAMNPVMGGGIMLGGGLLGVLFWSMILRRLLRAIHGESVPHLMPRWTLIAFALFFGLFGLTMFVLWAIGKAPAPAIYSGGVSVMFLVYAIRQLRQATSAPSLPAGGDWRAGRQPREGPAWAATGLPGEGVRQPASYRVYCRNQS